MIVAPRPFLRHGLGVLAAALVAGPGLARSPQFSAGTNLVRVYVSVTDAAGRPLTGLGQAAFSVQEDGVDRPVTVFAAGHLPLTLAVVLDGSFSMSGRPLEAARAGADALLAALEPGDRVSLLVLGSGIRVAAPLGTPVGEVRAALAAVTPWGTTPLGRGVGQAVSALDGDAGRRAVVLYTDGEERDDATDHDALLDEVRRRDVLVFPVVVGRPLSPFLSGLAAVSGGTAVAARTSRDAVEAARRMAADLHQQYLVGYEPPPGPGGWHRIRVRVRAPGAAVRARDGYYR